MHPPDAAADAPECHARTRWTTADRSHLCRLPPGHDGRHRCHACPHEWDTPLVLQPRPGP